MKLEYIYTIVEDHNGFWALVRDIPWLVKTTGGVTIEEHVVRYYQGFENAVRALRTRVR